jgi:hypothetical protein
MAPSWLQAYGREPSVEARRSWRAVSPAMGGIGLARYRGIRGAQDIVEPGPARHVSLVRRRWRWVDDVLLDHDILWAARHQ